MYMGKNYSFLIASQGKENRCVGHEEASNNGVSNSIRSVSSERPKMVYTIWSIILNQIVKLHIFIYA